MSVDIEAMRLTAKCLRRDARDYREGLYAVGTDATMESAADVIDSSADTIDRLQRNNKDQRTLLQIASARIDELLYYKAQTQALDAAQADNARLTAENAELRERCAAAEAQHEMWMGFMAKTLGVDRIGDIFVSKDYLRGPQQQEGAGHEDA
jgi:type II secretory pathway component HofQ